MFSSRTRWDLQPNRLAARLAARRAAGARLFDLTESNPTRARLHYPDDLLAAARASPPRGSTSRSRSAGASAREAAAADFARRGYPVPAERVFLTASTSEAYAFVFKLLADPGDEVLVPRPGYPLFEFLAGLESVEVRQLHARLRRRVAPRPARAARGAVGRARARS